MKLHGVGPSPICSECGGKCCKAMPGAIFYDDIPEPKHKTITDLLCSGSYSIDCWEGDVFNGEDGKAVCYFLRPATKTNPGKVFDYTWGGEACIFLTPTGCSLSFKKRPRGCRLLIPKESPGAECKLPKDADGANDKELAAKNWYHYSDNLEEIGQIVDHEKNKQLEVTS